MAQSAESGLPANSLPSFWTTPSQYSVASMASVAQRRIRSTVLFEGWRHIILGSWLNILLVMVPISWTVNLTMPKAHALKFIFSLLALIPLVNLHDLSTHELALRIGGSKAGLVNASLSNMVSIVVAICALRKCHLTFVQSALMGSMLSKLLLVLGLCFFAGGTRFSEQGFDPTAVQIHSSLLSVSVGALFLPAVYHFALGGSATDLPDVQKKGILQMSHGVAIVLFLVYGGYLVFQLWSHSYLYSDIHNRQSPAFAVRESKSARSSQDLPMESRQRDKDTDDFSSDSSFGDNSHSADGPLSHSVRYPVYSSPSNSQSRHPLVSQFTILSPESASSSRMALVGHYGESTVKLVPPAGGYPMARMSFGRSTSSASTMVYTGSQDGSEKIESPADTSQEGEGGDHAPNMPHEPRIGILLVVLVLVIVTVATSVTADWLVDSMDGISSRVSKEWVGLILLPAVTSLAECMTAVNVSVKDELSFSIGVAVGSAIQTALFVIPFIVTLAWAMGKPLSLLMDPFQSLVLYISVQTMGYVVVDGKSNWLEGMILICLYIIIAVTFWFYPGSSLPTSLAECVV
ncbi:hypothetical protein H2248_008443 [Termitomyces sp. 'cryptogamus']|nr:hypothetical protein H2248_008443 [Termitomyces sp. 'cryptogamus']